MAKTLHSHKAWTEVSSSTLCFLPKDCQLAPLCWDVVMCFLMSQPLMLSQIFCLKTPEVTLVQQTGEQDVPLWANLQLHFYFQQYAQGPRWDSQRYDQFYSMKYSAGQCTLYFLQLYLVMSFLVVCDIAAVFSNIQYRQLLYVFWSVFRTR